MAHKKTGRPDPLLFLLFYIFFIGSLHEPVSSAMVQVFGALPSGNSTLSKLGIAVHARLLRRFAENLDYLLLSPLVGTDMGRFAGLKFTVIHPRVNQRFLAAEGIAASGKI